MNVFEDLIEELKEDCLLEETINDFPESISDHSDDGRSADPVFEKVTSGDRKTSNPGRQNNPRSIGDPKKFASDEISALQMVEHVFTGIERDVLNEEPKPYSELHAKQALHRFMHCSADAGSEEAFDLESKLSAEIDNWKASLLKRDAKMSPANIRRYCETSQPPLSSQALFALVRFYFSTGLRAAAATKIDSVLTRLFSKKDVGERRAALVNKEETISHLRKRFSDWAGGASEATDGVPESMLSVLSFEDFLIEAEKVDNLEEFLKGDFFNRLIQFKESIREQFVSPEVMAACIRCNIGVGNAIVESLEKFGQRTNAARLKKKFGVLDHDAIAQAIGRTIDFDQLNTDSPETPVKKPQKQAEPKEQPHPSKPVKKKSSSQTATSGLFAVNKTLLLTAAILVSISVGLYVWTNYFGDAQSVNVSLPAVELDGFEYKEMVQTAKISGETMYAQMTPAWDALADDKKQELVQKLYAFASKKGVNKLNVLNIHGASVAFATPSRQELTER